MWTFLKLDTSTMESKHSTKYLFNIEVDVKNKKQLRNEKKCLILQKTQ